MLERSAEGAGKPIRVAQLIGRLSFGGAENQVVMLSNHLDRRSFERHVITMSESDKGFRNQLESDVRYFCLNYRRRKALVGFFRLYRYLRANHIDILHCHMYQAGLTGSLAAALARVPVVLVTEHGKNLWKNSWHRWVERNIVTPLIVFRLAVSEDIRQLRIHHEGIPAESIRLVKNAVDTTMIPGERLNRPAHIGALGRLVDAKDYGVLIRAMAVLRDRGFSLTLEIAGDGPEYDDLKSLVVEQQLEDSIKLSGFQDAGKFLERIDIFVISSKREGLPVSLLEAMAHGLPVVATRVGGIPEVIEDGKEGRLCEPENPDELAETIISLVEDRNLRLSVSRSARKKIEQNFSIQVLAEEMQSLYRDCLAIKSVREIL